MLFNSFGFLFLYLPVVLAGYLALGRYAHRLALLWLAAASVVFYGAWDPQRVPLLLASVVLNFAAGRLLCQLSGRARYWTLVAAVGLDLAALAYYKYAGFLAASFGLSVPAVSLPIGISFFTFTQIAFLVDCYRGHAAEYRFGNYLLFVSYFPHLVAGPVLHHREMMPQFAMRQSSRPDAAALAEGLTVFTIGLGKKVLIADNLAPLVAPVFQAGGHPALLEAWTGVLAYAFQLYFDFSGYSDMAIGLARLFGVRLPDNFNAPYRARNIAEFWRRWHMTLSRFLRDYLYIPLGGNRDGVARRYRNLLLTMVLGGLWHGAGWTFVAWGALHGSYLVLYHVWRERRLPAPPAPLASVLTFGAVLLAWVFFRAPEFATAGAVLQGLAGGNGVHLPHGWQAWLGHLPGVQYGGIDAIELEGAGLPALALAMVLTWGAPTTQELMARRWRPQLGWALACTAVLVVSVFSIQRPTEFLYFQF